MQRRCTLMSHPNLPGKLHIHSKLVPRPSFERVDAWYRFRPYFGRPVKELLYETAAGDPFWIPLDDYEAVLEARNELEILTFIDRAS